MNTKHFVFQVCIENTYYNISIAYKRLCFFSLSLQVQWRVSILWIALICRGLSHRLQVAGKHHTAVMRGIS